MTAGQCTDMIELQGLIDKRDEVMQRLTNVVRKCDENGQNILLNLS